MMQVMFGACLRVSETIGLTWSDVDMKNREIHVGGQLVYYEGDEGYCFHDSETKTDAGIRDIPMTQMVYDAFRKQRELTLMLGLQSNVEIAICSIIIKYLVSLTVDRPFSCNTNILLMKCT